MSLLGMKLFFINEHKQHTSSSSIIIINHHHHHHHSLSSIPTWMNSHDVTSASPL